MTLGTDARAAVGAVTLYFVSALVLLPPSEYARALGLGALVFGAVAAVGRVAGRGPVSGWSVFAVSVVALAVLATPTFPAMGGTHPWAVAVGFWGVPAAALLWVALRWPPQLPAPARVTLKQACRVGLFTAAALSAVATLPVLLALGSGGRRATPLLLVYPGYVGGLLAAATAYWRLQRMAHLATGRYLIGALGGTCVYGAVMPVVAVLDGKPMPLGVGLAIAGIAGAFVGPAVAFNLTGDVAAAERGAAAVEYAGTPRSSASPVAHHSPRAPKARS